MEIILRDDVDKVGLRGEVVTVADGYARNFLIPRGLAERATAAKVAEMRKRDELRSRSEARSHEEAQEVAATLEKTLLRFDVQAGPTGTLFGSVTPTNIADELWTKHKVRVDRRKIGLDEPLKRIGRYSVPIEIFQSVTAEVQTHVVPEGGELPPEEELAALEAAAREAEVAAAAAQEAEPEEVDELIATAEMEEQERPDDEFDRAVDAGAEPESGPGSEPE